MRILVCAAFYPPYRGGYAESVRLLAEGLAARGHAVTVVACAEKNAPLLETVNGVMVRRVPAWNPSFLHGSFPIPNPFLFLRELARAGRADIISTQTRFFISTLIGFIFGKWRGIPVVHTERGASHTTAHTALVRTCALLVDYTAGWLVCVFSRGVVGVSHAATDFTRHLGARAPITIYNGIDAAWWQRPDAYPRAFPFPRIVFVGRLVYAKGVDDLLHAAAVLVKEFPALSVAIVGDGPHQLALMRRALALGIENAVIFYGALAREGVRDALWNADICVNPSYSEGFPRSVLEAAAAGLPIIATDVGGTREIADNAIMLIPSGNTEVLANAMRYVMSNESVRNRMAHSARRGAFSHTISDMAESYEKYFISYSIL